MIDSSHTSLSIRKQSAILSVPRSSYYYKNKESKNEDITKKIVKIYEEYPIYGYRRITAMLVREGLIINRKRVYRIMHLCNIRAIYPGPNTSKRNFADAVRPYLLRGYDVTYKHEVWQVDITYIRTQSGFMYLVSIIDVYTRIIVSWKLSSCMDVEFVISNVENAIAEHGAPKIINSDQGSQFTCKLWIDTLEKHKIQVSMNSKGRSNDNSFIERVWRTVKYEYLFLHDIRHAKGLKQELRTFMHWYNYLRPHQSLGYMTPAEKGGCGFVDNSCELPTSSTFTT